MTLKLILGTFLILSFTMVSCSKVSFSNAPSGECEASEDCILNPDGTETETRPNPLYDRDDHGPVRLHYGLQRIERCSRSEARLKLLLRTPADVLNCRGYARADVFQAASLHEAADTGRGVQPDGRSFHPSHRRVFP